MRPVISGKAQHGAVHPGRVDLWKGGGTSIGASTDLGHASVVHFSFSFALCVGYNFSLNLNPLMTFK